MKPNVTVTPLARNDLKGIKRYIAKDNPQRSASFIKELYDQCLLWAENPLSGKDRSDLQPNLRSFPYGNYIILYSPENNGIAIIRVLHAARDLPSHFQ